MKKRCKEIIWEHQEDVGLTSGSERIEKQIKDIRDKSEKVKIEVCGTCETGPHGV